MSDREPEWVEVRVLCPSEWSELVAGAITDWSGGSVAFGRSSLAVGPVPEANEQVRGFFERRRDSPEFRAELQKRLKDLGEATGDRQLALATPEYKVLPFEDWAESWKKSWKAYRVGRFAVVPYDWEGEPKPEDVPMRLEPAGAFGTGRHPTTRHCLRFLSNLDLAGKRVLDAGCGSGILSVAAMLLGAESVLGFDIDERSVPEGEALCRRNGVDSNVEFVHGGFETLEGRTDEFDVVLANIYYDVLAAGLDSIERVARQGCALAFSGLHERFVDRAVDGVHASNLEVVETWARGRWRTVLARQPSS